MGWLNLVKRNQLLPLTGDAESGPPILPRSEGDHIRLIWPGDGHDRVIGIPGRDGERLSATEWKEQDFIFHRFVLGELFQADFVNNGISAGPCG